MNAQPLYTLAPSDSTKDTQVSHGSMPSQAVLDAIVSCDLKDALVRAQDRHDKIYLLTDTPSFKPIFLRACTQDTRLMCGMEVLTPTQLISSLWDIWGDERKRLSDTERYLAVRDVLEYIDARCKNHDTSHGTSPVAEAVSRDVWDEQASCFNFSVNEGVIRTIADVFKQAYQYIPHVPSSQDDVQRWLVMVARVYGSYIQALGRIEDTELLDALDACLPQDYAWGTCVTAFYKHASYAREFERKSIAWLEKHTTVHHVISHTHKDDIPSYLRQPYDCSPELALLRQHLFSNEGSQQTHLTPTGAFTLLHASGPLATPQIICHTLTSLISSNPFRRALVACQNPQDMWHKLACKLAYAHVRVHGNLRYKLSEIASIQLFFAFVREIVRLAHLADTWSKPHTDEAGCTYISLDDMSWWPPVAIIDFLTCDICEMSIASVYKLDEQWRQNRLLTPQTVLSDLTNPSKVSRTVAKIVRALITKNISSALYHLLDGYMNTVTRGDTRDFYINAQNEQVYTHDQYQDALKHEINVRAYIALKSLCDELVQYSQSIDAPRAHTSALDPADRMHNTLHTVSMLEALSVYKNVDVSVCLEPAKDTHSHEHKEKDTSAALPLSDVSSFVPEVYIMNMHASARQLPQTFDVVVIGDATSTQSPIIPTDTLVSRLLEKLNITPTLPKTNPAYIEFMQVVSCATSHLIVQRELSDTDMKPCYPSVMLSELLSLYGIADDTGAYVPKEAKHCLDRMRTTLDEQDILSCMDPTSCADERVSQAPPLCEHVSCVGKLRDDVRQLVSLPPQGAKGHTHRGSELFLSASQLEAYLRCPYEWFYGRRIHLNDADAKFSPLERGSFAHKVLEDTHRVFFLQASAHVNADENMFEGEKTHALATALHEMASSEAQNVMYEPTYIKEAEITLNSLPTLEYIFDMIWDKTNKHQYLKRPAKEQMRAQALIPHNLADTHELERMKEDIHDFLSFEAIHIRGFVPTCFEWNFGKKNIVEYAGVHVTGSIDRVDIDKYGNVLIIDYKHKSPHGFESTYAPMSSALAKSIADNPTVDALELPRHIQTLLYAQIIRKKFPQLHVVGALYVATQKPYAISGAIKEGFEGRIWGQTPSKTCTTRMCISDSLQFEGIDACGFEGLLDATEKAIAEHIEPLKRGEIAPIDVSDAHRKTCFACACAYQEKRSFAHES